MQALEQDDAITLNSRGNALRGQNRPAEALASYDRALECDPDFAPALYNRGNVLLELDRPEEAVLCFDRVLALDPGDAEALAARGNALTDLRRVEEALASYDRALSIDPHYAAALYNRGNALMALERPGEALASYDSALALDPEFVQAHANRGKTLAKLERFDDALASFDGVLAREPDSIDTLFSRGNVLLRLWRAEDAIADYDRVLALMPTHMAALNNRAQALGDLKRHADALATYARACAIDTNVGTIRYNESLCRLLMGDFAAGWRAYEWRWHDEQFVPFKRDFVEPLWLGDGSIAGKTILLHAEQGLGDTIQFCRYAKKVAALGATVVMEVRPPLASLLEGIEGVSRLITYGQPLPAFDYHCPLLSLPLAFDTRLDTIPAGIPYLRAERSRVRHWAERLGEPRLPRIGVVWSGTTGHKNDHNRSIALADFIALVSGDAQFVSLQKEVRSRDAELLSERSDIVHFGGQLQDFADTAALIESMDVVVTVDTAVAHVAGAMGKPVWILLPYNPDWRWLLDRDDSPWYPTARLFRQEAPGDWGRVMERVAKELHKQYALIAHGRAAAQPMQTTDALDPASDQPRPEMIVHRLHEALAHHQRGELTQAEALYRELLESAPANFDALHLLGVVEHQRGRHEAAVKLIQKAIQSDPTQATAYSNLGLALQKLERLDDAVAAYDRAVALQPGYAEAYLNRGNALREQKRLDEALASYEQALAVRPDYVDALCACGNILSMRNRPGEALAAHDRALALSPDHVEALSGRGDALVALKRSEEALASYERALQIDPHDAIVVNNRGNALRELERYEEALESYVHALALRPDFLDAINNRGNLLVELRRFGEAAECFARLVALAPDYELALGSLLDCRLRCCDWDDVASFTKRIEVAIARGVRVTTPFSFLAISDSPAAQLQCARTFASSHAVHAALDGKRDHARHDRIRLAYLSPDFRDHPVSHLMVGLLETHDRRRFETIGVSFGPQATGEMHERIHRSFEQFFDVRHASDYEVAKMLRELQVDIAVDLAGYTTHCRPGILAHRAAPVQVSYLGYPGTMGARHIDYILADRFVIPEIDRVHYRENVVYLPDTFQPNDARRPIAPHPPTRTELGLPEAEVVFCSFNSSYKITPLIFDIWMRLLREVRGSVLWLQQANDAALHNLRWEAQTRGVAAERLVFAQTVGRLEDHLARHRLADLFLDTLPYNAHTTASDALWAGLPVLTCSGGSYAGRVAGSLLNAVGLPELITHSLGDYELLAVDLATKPWRLNAIRAKLERNRNSHPLFDTDRFRRHIESAYVTMWQRHMEQKSPAPFAVPACDNDDIGQ